MRKFNVKFLECISEIIYNNPKAVKILNEHRRQFGLVVFDKQQSKVETLVDAMGYQIFFHIKDTETKLKIQPIVLTSRGWVEVDEPLEGVLTGKDHFLFKPLPNIIMKSYAEELEKNLEKIETKFIKKQVSDTDP